MTTDEQLVGEALPSYEIHGELGRGGWGVVLGGRHRQLGREVAIKQLPPNFASDPTVMQRFAVEARVLASLDHPHIVPVYDYVERQGLCLLVMEQLPGGTLWSRFTTVGFTPAMACALVMATCAGLQNAHDHQILHRDIKPENLMFSADGTLKVTDFGIAKVVGGTETMATKAGEVVGTPAYIAPEQVRGLALGPPTDVYAAATMLYEMLCGELPFADDGDPMVLLFKHAFEAPTPLREKAPGIPDRIADVVMSALAIDAADRPASAEAFAVALAEACTEAWGPGWLVGESVPVMGAGSIVAATERVSARPGELAGAGTALAHGAAGTAPETVVPAGTQQHAETANVPGGGTPPPPPARPTVLSGDGVLPPPPPPATTGPPPPPPVAPPTTAVRPAVDSHARGVDLGSVAATDLVPVNTVVAPSSPAPARVVTLLLVVAVIVLALVGLGGVAHSGTLAPGAVTVAGADPVAPSTIPLDLSKPVTVDVSRSAPPADHVRLRLRLLGQALVTDTSTLAAGAGGSTAAVDAGNGRYLVASHATAELDLLRDGAVVGTETFPVRSTTSALLTVPTGVVVLLALVGLAYGESFLRALRRNKRQPSSTVGLVIVGAVIGVVCALAAWLVGASSALTGATLIVCALVGAAAGVAAAVTGIRIGRLRRFKRKRSRTAARA